MKRTCMILSGLLLLLGGAWAETRTQLVFPVGEKVSSPSFIGDFFIRPMIRYDETFHFPSTNTVTFSPGARSPWHTHGGMVVLVTGGVGYYQEAGKPAQILRQGDILDIPAGVLHWHGATKDSWFSQMVVWDDAYHGDDSRQMLVADAWYNHLAGEEYQGNPPSDGWMFHRPEGVVKLPAFTGTISLADVVGPDNAAGAPAMHYVVFDEGVASDWHSHEGGQILIATDGVGCHQMEGGPLEVLHPGDVAFCPPGVKHFHGAAPGSTFAHLAVNTNPDRPGVTWYGPAEDTKNL